MSIAGLLLGVINIAIIAALLIILGIVVRMVTKWFGYDLDPQLTKFYLLLVLLIVLYMFVALIFGMPTINLFSHPQWH